MDDQTAKAVRDKDNWPILAVLYLLAMNDEYLKVTEPELTLLSCSSQNSNSFATVASLCLTAVSPNHWDSYPYLMIRALGIALGSISGDSNQFVLIFLIFSTPSSIDLDSPDAVHDQSGSAPMP